MKIDIIEKLSEFVYEAYFEEVNGNTFLDIWNFTTTTEEIRLYYDKKNVIKFIKGTKTFINVNFVKEVYNKMCRKLEEDYNLEKDNIITGHKNQIWVFVIFFLYTE